MWYTAWLLYSSSNLVHLPTTTPPAGEGYKLFRLLAARAPMPVWPHNLHTKNHISLKLAHTLSNSSIPTCTPGPNYGCTSRCCHGMSAFQISPTISHLDSIWIVEAAVQTTFSWPWLICPNTIYIISNSRHIAELLHESLSSASDIYASLHHSQTSERNIIFS